MQTIWQAVAFLVVFQCADFVKTSGKASVQTLTLRRRP